VRSPSNSFSSSSRWATDRFKSSNDSLHDPFVTLQKDFTTMKNALAISASSIPMPKSKGKARPAEDTWNRGELNHIGIDITENGCDIICSFDPKEIDPKFDRYNQRPEDEKMSYGGDDPAAAVDQALAYIKKMMLAQVNYEAEEDKGAKGGKKAKPAAGEPPEPEAAA
jgi:hypothetical protein